LRIDHIAIAVRSIEEGAEVLGRLLSYQRLTRTVTNSRQKVNVLFLGKPGSLDIKLIEPSDAESPLWPFIRRGGGLHHVCFKVDDVVDACAALAEKGARVLAPPAPGEAFDDNLIAFCYLGLGLNAELIGTDARRNRLDDAAS
jgi:methylmalonyl-CoA/ethylmalonyl-CoA epimerase